MIRPFFTVRKYINGYDISMKPMIAKLNQSIYFCYYKSLIIVISTATTVLLLFGNGNNIACF